MWKLNRQLQTHEEKSIAHNKMFYREILKLKTPTIIYYVYHGIMKQSHTNIISYISQYNMKSSHTVIQKLVHTCTNLLPPDGLPPLRNPCWWVSLNEFDISLPWIHNPHWQLQWVCICIECITIVTTDSQTHPFTYLSTRSPLDLTCK